jgi:thiamine biosynthesis lipoprotein
VSESLLVLFFASLIAASGADLRMFEAVEPHMGTLFRIRLYAASEPQASAAFRAAFDRIGELDATLSDYKPESELNRICRIAAGIPTPISEDLFRVLAASQKLAEESGGAFDVTLGPVIRLWREARTRRKLPDAVALREARARCGYRKLRLNQAARTVTLDQAGMQLDVGGIAKGDAADQALAVLGRLGVHSALVAASGDLAFSDSPPGERGWKIGVDSLDRAESDFTSVLYLRNAAVSTSGDTEQGVDIEGARYSHIIDPATGMGLTGRITVTIVAPRGIDADGMATAVSVLGAARGMSFVEQHAPTAALVITNGRAIRSHLWKKL